MKTVGHILPFHAVGGTEHATVRIAESVDSSRFRHVAFYVSGADPVRTFLEGRGLRAVPYDPPIPSYRHAVRFVRASLEMSRLLKEHKIDLVHCADLLAAHYGALAGKLAGLPVISHIRARFDVISRRDCSFLWPVDSFVFVSSNTRDHFGCASVRHRGTIVYDGIDVAPKIGALQARQKVRGEFGIAATAPVIAMVSRIAPAKDFATLAKGARRILALRPDVRFLVVGDLSSTTARAHYEYVADVLRQNGVERAFIFTGHREDISSILSATDVFVLSTHLEGLPLVILEAMACGRPVVATSVGGIPEIVRSGENGLLFEHEDAEALAMHVLRLLDDGALASRLAAAGLHVIETRFSRRQFGESMTDAYARALGLGPQHDRSSEGGNV